MRERAHMRLAKAGRAIESARRDLGADAADAFAPQAVEEMIRRAKEFLAAATAHLEGDSDAPGTV